MSNPPTPDRWSQLISLIDALLDTPPERRAALIEGLSNGDPARRAEIERVLAECEHELPILTRPATERFAALIEPGAPTFPAELAERYRLTKEVGRGGMATVFLAHDLKHARDVAIKVVDRLLMPALGSARFLREIEIAAQLHHPHIVPLYDSGTADGSLYYVMPYESGASVRHRLAREGPLPIDDAVLILRDVADALAHAHAHGIVHRDIKPDNILLSGRHAMVADFGIAKAISLARSDAGRMATAARSSDSSIDALTVVGTPIGTPAYMAPEQISGSPAIDHRVDLYALGALGYELIAGRPPFVAESQEEVLAAHLTQTPAPLATYRPDVPAPLAELVMTCLAKRPEDRWQSAQDVVRRLDGIAITGSEMGRQTGRATTRRGRWGVALATAAATVIAVAAVVLLRREWRADASVRSRWANAQVQRLTDFPGSEVDAAISRDGRFVAFLADRDSVFDAFVTQVGGGTFVNLTGGRFPQLLNEDVRNIGFSADGAHTWVRIADIASPASVSLAPTLGGPLRPFLGTAVMVAWSPDGSKIAYHETTPGDPIYVADATGGNARRIFVAEPGVHSHHVTWSPDGRFLYFAHGVPPDEMDVWRVPADSGAAERVTAHNSTVAYPVMLDDRTLLYTATADDGTGPWLYSMDLDRRVSERVSSTVEHYISIAAAAEVAGQGTRLVATVSNPTVDLWTIPVADTVVGEQAAGRLALPTARAAAPRFGPDGSLLYLATRGGADGVWRLAGGSASDSPGGAAGTAARELWKSPEGAVVGAVAISPDGTSACFSVRRRSRSTLHCMSADGTGARTVAESLDVRGAASWSPDGKWLAVAAKQGSAVRVFKVPLDGGAPVRLVDSVSSNPVWSPNGAFILYSGTPRARSVPVRAVTPDGRPYPFPAIAVDRIGDSYRFLPDGSALVVKLGGFRRQDFWLLDLATGRQRRLTSLRPGESLQRFDVSPDGRRILFERVRENSDIALITLPPR